MSVCVGVCGGGGGVCTKVTLHELIDDIRGITCTVYHTRRYRRVESNPIYNPVTYMHVHVHVHVHVQTCENLTQTNKKLTTY